MRFLTLFILLFLTLNSLSAQIDSLLIENVTILPLHPDQRWTGRDVLIHDGEIVSIREHLPADTTEYGPNRIDGTGKFLLPGFVDAHAHLPEPGEIDRYFLLNLVNGVTGLRSMRGADWHPQIDRSAPLTPRLLLGSPPVSRRDTLDEVSAPLLLRDYRERGFDFVKILSVRDQTTFDHLVRAARKESLPLAGHCPSNVGLFNVSDSGVYQSVEHLGGFFRLPDIETINRAIVETAAAGIYHCPTLDWYYTSTVSAEKLRQRDGVEFLPLGWVSEWEENIGEIAANTDPATYATDSTAAARQYQLRTNYLSYLYRQGAYLLVGPDASGTYGIPGYGYHTELEHMSEAGISETDLLRAACLAPARMVGEEHRWGTIRVGASPELVLLNEDPEVDIRNTRKVAGVVLRGVYYDRESLLEQLRSLAAD